MRSGMGIESDWTLVRKVISTEQDWDSVKGGDLLRPTTSAVLRMFQYDAATLLLGVGVVVVLLTSLFLYGRRGARRRYAAMINKFPGPPTIPLLGNALDDLAPRNRIMRMMDERHAKYGPIYRSWSGGHAEIHLTKPDHIEVVLNSTKHINKSWAYEFMHPWLGQGLLTSTGAKWHARRRMITPTFHFKILETFFDIFVENGDILVSKLRGAMQDAGSKPLDVYPFITRCALDIICQTAMGTDVKAQEDANSEYVQAIAEISELILQRALRPWLYSDFIFYKTELGRRYKHCLDVLHGFTSRVIQERKVELSKSANVDSNKKGEHEADELIGSKKRVAFLDLLLAASEENDSLTDVDLREEVDTFMFEGHDTTTAGMSWALFLLAAYPDVQEKAIQELDDIFQGSDRSITMRDVQEMKYLDRVIKESLRLYPSAPFIGREPLEDIQCGEYVIPAGCTINIHIYHVHRDPEHFPDPDRFDPDRFLPERIQGRHPYSYIPFSAGARNCIGQKFAMLEEKTLIASILRNFKLRAVEKREDLVLISELILRPESGIKLVLTQR